MSSVIPAPPLRTPTLPAPVPLTLQPGAALTATVLAVLDDSTLRLQLAGGTLDLKTGQPLAQGTRVLLTVAGTPAQPTLTLAPVAAPRLAAIASVATPAGGTLQAQPATTQHAVTLASTAAVTPSAEATRAYSQPAIVPDGHAPAAVAAAVRSSAARQGGLAQLYANVEAALARPNLALPAPVRAAAVQVLNLRLDTVPGGAIKPGAIKAALDAARATADPVSVSPAPQLAPGALKSALLALQRSLSEWVMSNAAAGDDAAARLPPPAAQAVLQLPAVRAAPMPPFPDAPTVPQPSAPPSLPATAAPADIAVELLGQTEAALARQTLLQVASLPADDGPAGQKADSSHQRLTLDLPMSMDQGTSIAQFRIERDQERTRDGGARPVWRVTFAIDIEPIGKVDARISLTGARAAVALFAERTESAQELADSLPLLEACLREAALEPGDLRCRAGKPAVAPAAPGLFVNQAS